MRKSLTQSITEKGSQRDAPAADHAVRRCRDLRQTSIANRLRRTAPRCLDTLHALRMHTQLGFQRVEAAAELAAKMRPELACVCCRSCQSPRTDGHGTATLPEPPARPSCCRRSGGRRLCRCSTALSSWSALPCSQTDSECTCWCRAFLARRQLTARAAERLQPHLHQHGASCSRLLACVLAAAAEMCLWCGRGTWVSGRAALTTDREATTLTTRMTTVSLNDDGSSSESGSCLVHAVVNGLAAARAPSCSTCHFCASAFCALQRQTIACVHRPQQQRQPSSPCRHWWALLAGAQPSASYVPCLGLCS